MFPRGEGFQAAVVELWCWYGIGMKSSPVPSDGGAGLSIDIAFVEKAG